MAIPPRLLWSLALVAVIFAAALPVTAQVQYGSREPLPADFAQRVAAAQAEFWPVLANALSPDSIGAMLNLIKDKPSLADGGVTNFDNVTAPCLFLDTAPLLGPEQFAAFWAPPPNGGAIVNQCGNWNLNAHSPPNFLAFNTSAQYGSGGVPKTPELIFVGTSRSSVSLWISSGTPPAYPVGVVALGKGGVKGLVIAFTSPEWQQITVTGVGIEAIALVGNPMLLMVDDIQSQ